LQPLGEKMQDLSDFSPRQLTGLLNKSNLNPYVRGQHDPQSSTIFHLPIWS